MRRFLDKSTCKAFSQIDLWSEMHLNEAWRRDDEHTVDLSSAPKIAVGCVPLKSSSLSQLLHHSLSFNEFWSTTVSPNKDLEDMCRQDRTWQDERSSDPSLKLTDGLSICPRTFSFLMMMIGIYMVTESRASLSARTEKKDMAVAARCPWFYAPLGLQKKSVCYKFWCRVYRGLQGNSRTSC